MNVLKMKKLLPVKIRNLIINSYQRYNPRSLEVFQTSVGVKYKNSDFNSSQFNKYIQETKPFTSLGIEFADLVIGPDLLMNNFTSCSTPLPESPHYFLMVDIDAGNLSVTSEYISRSERGILDARLPRKCDLDFLSRQFVVRKKQVYKEQSVDVAVVKVSINRRIKYMIVDGKHRAAMAAYLNLPKSLNFHLLSILYTKEPFFQKIYKYILELEPHQYSINQKMIKAIYNNEP